MALMWTDCVLRRYYSAWHVWSDYQAEQKLSQFLASLIILIEKIPPVSFLSRFSFFFFINPTFYPIVIA